MKIGRGYLEPNRYLVNSKLEKNKYLLSRNLLTWLSQKMALQGEDANIYWYGMEIGTIEGESVYLYNNVQECIKAAFYHPKQLCGWVFHSSKGFYILVMRAIGFNVEYEYFISEDGMYSKTEGESRIVNNVIDDRSRGVIKMMDWLEVKDKEKYIEIAERVKKVEIYHSS